MRSCSALDFSHCIVLVIIALTGIVVFVACRSEPAPTATPASTSTPAPTATATPQPTPTPMPFYGRWETFDEIDPLTQKPEVAIFLSSNDGLLPALGIRCQQSELELLVGWTQDDNSPISEFPWISVQHRIDDDPIQDLEWSISTNGTATFLPYGEIAYMIQKLYGAEEFVVQVIPDRSGPINAVFEPAGLYWAVKPVLEACEVEVD